MSRPRFLADHDLTIGIVRGVLRREPAIAFARLFDLGLERQPDEEILRFAARERWIVVSHDVNSMSGAAISMLAAGEPMHGLLLSHQLAAIAPIIESLIIIWSVSEAEEWTGRIEYLPL